VKFGGGIYKAVDAVGDAFEEETAFTVYLERTHIYIRTSEKSIRARLLEGNKDQMGLCR
jgi:hypothetical protein